jgi:dihydroxy-acid dehydratase
VDVNSDTLDCVELSDPATAAARRRQWQAEAKRNNGLHPLVRPVDSRLLRRMRAWALPPLQGAGLSDAGSAGLG